jgi:hypothetical protein
MFGWLKKVKAYFHNDAVAVDQAINVFGGGKPGETISSRSQRAADRGNVLGEIISDGLDVIQADHGHKAMRGDLRRAQDVEATEKAALEPPAPKPNQ